MVMWSNHRQQGFSLLEVLVALSLLAFSLAVLLRIYGGAARNLVATEGYARATAIAESELARVGAEPGLALRTYERDAGGGYHVRVTVEPFEPARRRIQAALEPYLVSVEVAWGERATRTVTASTVRLGASK